MLFIKTELDNYKVVHVQWVIFVDFSTDYQFEWANSQTDCTSHLN